VKRPALTLGELQAAHQPPTQLAFRDARAHSTRSCFIWFNGRIAHDQSASRARTVPDPHVADLDDDDLLARRVLGQQVRGVDLRKCGGSLSIGCRLGA